jgi:hypothetical protein
MSDDMIGLLSVLAFITIASVVTIVRDRMKR